MKKTARRTPKNYDGTQLTTRKFSELLPLVLTQINEAYHERPDLVLAAWPEIIGSKLAAMTEAASFFDGILTVKVKNSTLYSLLCRNDKPRIMASLKRKFPQLHIRDIVFRIS